MIKRKLNETDITYKIIAVGKELNIPPGEEVTVYVEGKQYQAKMHNKTKGRIDRMGAFYAENSFAVGDELELKYEQDFFANWNIYISRTADTSNVNFESLKKNYCESNDSTASKNSFVIEAGQYKGSDFVSFSIPDGVMHIGRDAFAFCKNLKEIIIPDSVVCIDEAAFWCCSSLETVQLPESLRYLGTSAFGNCTSLQKINIPRQITVIPPGCFNECTSLKEVEISSNVRVIMDYAFKNCVSLSSFSLYCHESLSAIFSGAFSGCGNFVFETIDQKVMIGDCGYSAVDARSVMIDKEAFNWGQLTIRTFQGTAGAKLAQKYGIKVEYVKDCR